MYSEMSGIYTQKSVQLCSKHYKNNQSVNNAFAGHCAGDRTSRVISGTFHASDQTVRMSRARTRVMFHIIGAPNVTPDLRSALLPNPATTRIRSQRVCPQL